MSKTITITQAALSSMLPQASILNLSIPELDGAEFTIQDLVNADRASAEFGDNGQDNNRLRLKLTSNKSSKPVILNVNQFLRLPISGTATEGAAAKTVLDHLQETVVGDGDISFPNKFTVVDAASRTEKGHEVYPSYMYEKMDENVATFRKAFRTLSETGKLPKGASGEAMTEREYVGQAYGDFDLISKLPGTPLLERYRGKAEPIKTFSVEL
jgi:hypothetical protein